LNKEKVFQKPANYFRNSDPLFASNCNYLLARQVVTNEAENREIAALTWLINNDVC